MQKFFREIPRLIHNGITLKFAWYCLFFYFRQKLGCTMNKMVFFIVALSLIFSPSIFASRYKYNELMLKDYDEMSRLINERIAQAKKISSAETQTEDESSGQGRSPSDNEAIAILRDGLLLCLSRPDKDNMLAKLIPILRKELINYSAFEDSLLAIANDAIAALKTASAPTATKSTYLFVLENIMAEMKPQLHEKKEYRSTLEKIRDAKIEVSKDVVKDRKLRSMFSTESPSDLAATILNNPPPRPKAEDKKTTPKPESDDLGEE